MKKSLVVIVLIFLSLFFYVIKPSLADQPVEKNCDELGGACGMSHSGCVATRWYGFPSCRIVCADGGADIVCLIE